MLSNEQKAYFQTFLDISQIIDDETELKNIGLDWTKGYDSNASIALLPKNTEEVSKIVKFCNEQGLKIVPSGGRTGLCAGAIATNKEIIVSLQKMNRITEVDPIGLTLRAEAGVTTQDIQVAAEKENLFFSLDLAAKGSSMIGGNLATNAGGLKLIKYGGTREQVLGLEVVLASGEILDIDTSLRKNNTGYDLKQLFIGSEGTLGIITNVTLKLAQKPKNLELVCLGVEKFEDILSILKECNISGISISAFEFFTDLANQKVLACFPQTKAPFSELPPYFLILEAECSKEDFEDLIAKSFEKGFLLDGIISQSSSAFKELWSLRENITESLAAIGHVRKNDISIPIAQLANFVNDTNKIIENNANKHIEVILFGHIGDGNIHLNYLGNKDIPFDKFTEQAIQIESQIFDLLPKYKGSISAEHGIGLTKKSHLHLSCSQLEIDIMKKIKSTLDPKNTMNPGKIFDLP